MFLTGLNSSSMDMEYTWPVNWDIPDFTSILEPLYFMNSLHSTHPNLLPLIRSLGPHFLRSLTSALLASNQHFPSLLLATLYGLRSGHTTLCVQGIFGAGKTFSASLQLIVLSTILDVNTLLSAEPNLPLATAIENIDLLLQDASDDVRAQYGRILANHVKVLYCATSAETTPNCNLSYNLAAWPSTMRPNKVAKPASRSWLGFYPFIVYKF